MPASRSWQDIRKDLQQTGPQAQTPAATTQQVPTTAVAARQAPPKRPSPPPKPEKPFAEVMGEIKRVLLFVAFFSFIINLLMLVGPLYMMQVYDRVLTSGSVPTLLFLTLAAGGLIFVGSLLEGARARILVRLGGRFDELLSARMFARSVVHGLTGKTDQNTSLRDLDTFRTFLTGAGLFFFFDAPWTPLFLAVIFLLHPLLCLVAATGAAILFVLALVSELATRKPLTTASQHMSLAMQFAGNASTNADTVEAMGMMPGLRARWQQQYRRGLYLQSRASDRAGLLTATTKFIRPMLQVAILGVGAYLALNQVISAGAMIAASIMMGRALAPVEGAIGNWRSFVLARNAYGRIRETLTSAGRKTSSLMLPSPVGAVSVERLFGGPPNAGKPIIKGVAFELRAGEALGLIGPSASGKSTLAKLLVGVWPGLQGSVRLDGADIAEWDRAALGPYVGYLSQNIELFDGTIADNIARFGQVDSEAVIAAARDAGVHEMILRLPEGYDTRTGPGGAMLSGGQRQRVGLARALYGQPTLIVLDEPNANLDGHGDAALLKALWGIKARGATLIVIAHRPSILEVVDKILVLREGTMAQFGDRETVLWDLTHPSARASDTPEELEQRRTAGAIQPPPAPNWKSA